MIATTAGELEKKRQVQPEPRPAGDDLGDQFGPPRPLEGAANLRADDPDVHLRPIGKEWERVIVGENVDLVPRLRDVPNGARWPCHDGDNPFVHVVT